MRIPDIKLVAGILLAGLLLGYAMVLLPDWVLGPPGYVVALPLVIGVAAFAFLVLRIGSFYRKLRQFVRLLLAGNFEAAIRGAGYQYSDEITRLEKDLNAFAEQLRTYDRLRAERVQTHRRAVDMLLEHTSQPVMVLDVERETLACNPSLCGRLGVEGKAMALPAVEAVEDNRALVALLRAAGDEQKTAQSGAVAVRLPGQESAVTLNVKVVPVGSREGESKLVLVLVEEGAAPSID